MRNYYYMTTLLYILSLSVGVSDVRDFGQIAEDPVIGEWELVLIKSGVPSPLEKWCKGATVTFTTKNLIVTTNKQRIELCEYRIDRSRLVVNIAPGNIDFIDSNSGKIVSRGIFKYDGVKLEMCISNLLEAPKRPNNFLIKSGSEERVLIILDRKSGRD